ncbi:MAG: GDSL-like lipase/acylhydrolase family protein [Gemmatimonadetes bacterium]|nr:GDSL-like lipase/acylhydrolase family protein [Gemmatimonadota bacterium]
MEPKADAVSLGRSRWTGVRLALGSVLATLAVLEAGMWIFHPLPDPYAALKGTPGSPRFTHSRYVPSAYPPHFAMDVRAEPGLPGIDGRPRRFSVNGLGYRGDPLAVPKPTGELRVFVVGGSTTECLYLADAEALTAVLQARLRALAPGVDVRVYGAGKSGDRSFDHVAMVAHRIAHLQPDVIVVFAGINDVLAAIRRRDYLMRDDPGDAPPLGHLGGLKLLATELQLPRLVHRALTGYDPQTVTIVSDYRKNAAHLRALPLTRRAPRTDVVPYAENLRSLAGTARANGARIVFMTQQTTWSSPDPRAAPWHWMGSDSVRYRETALDSAMSLYNAAMRRVAAEQGAPVLDLARTVPKSMDYFYDDVHFNVRGAATTADLLARFLIDRAVIPRTPAATSAAG